MESNWANYEKYTCGLPFYSQTFKHTFGKHKQRSIGTVKNVIV